MGLRLRLVLLLMIPPILVFGVYGVMRVRIGQAELLEETQRNVTVIGKAVQVAVERALPNSPASALGGMLADIVDEQEQIDRLRIFDRALRPTLVSNSLRTEAGVSSEVLRRVMLTGRGEGFSERRGADLLFYYVAPLRGPRNAVVGALEIVHLGSGIDQRIRAATWDIVVRLSVLVISITALTWAILQRQLVRPLFALMQGIRDLGRGGPTRRLPVERRDELGRVAEAFNAMAEQLQAARHELTLETERTLDLEQQLRHSATLAVAGRLASGLAHEVGTPLNIISGRAEFLLRGLPPDDPRREELNVIIGQIDRISTMIRSLLDTVRPMKPDIQPTALKGVVDGLLVLLAHTARRHGVSLDVAIPDDLPPLRADRNQLQQVLINILMNAFEAAQPTGEVKLVARAASRGASAGVEIAIHDTGPGIPAPLLPRIFDPFFSTKPPGEGTGLGLPICRDILKSHDGHIEAQSAPGHGTTFLLWFPEERTVPA